MDSASKGQLKQNFGCQDKSQKDITMQAEVVPLSTSGALDEDVVAVPADPANVSVPSNAEKKLQEKSFKIDFSAFCDCV